MTTSQTANELLATIADQPFPTTEEQMVEVREAFAREADQPSS